MSKPDWNYWRDRRTASLWEAVALTCDVEPRNRDGRKRPYWQGLPLDNTREYQDRLEIVLDHAQGYRELTRAPFILPSAVGDTDEDRPVSINKFALWVRGIGWEQVPEEFWTLAVTDDDPTALQRWPWGTYETDLLRKMAAAAARFWGPYNPKDPSSAPTNDQVVAWLVEQGVSKRLAQTMATILRADGLPTGPRN